MSYGNPYSNPYGNPWDSCNAKQLGDECEPSFTHGADAIEFSKALDLSAGIFSDLEDTSDFWQAVYAQVCLEELEVHREKSIYPQCLPPDETYHYISPPSTYKSYFTETWTKLELSHTNFSSVASPWEGQSIAHSYPTLRGYPGLDQIQQHQQSPEVVAASSAEESPLYVNAKQFHRILKRRMARQKLEEALRLTSKGRKPYPVTILSTEAPDRKRKTEDIESARTLRIHVRRLYETLQDSNHSLSGFSAGSYETFHDEPGIRIGDFYREPHSVNSIICGASAPPRMLTGNFSFKKRFAGYSEQLDPSTNGFEDTRTSLAAVEGARVDYGMKMMAYRKDHHYPPAHAKISSTILAISNELLRKLESWVSINSARPYEPMESAAKFCLIETGNLAQTASTPATGSETGLSKLEDRNEFESSGSFDELGTVWLANGPPFLLALLLILTVYVATSRAAALHSLHALIESIIVTITFFTACGLALIPGIRTCRQSPASSRPANFAKRLLRCLSKPATQCILIMPLIPVAAAQDPTNPSERTTSSSLALYIGTVGTAFLLFCRTFRSDVAPPLFGILMASFAMAWVPMVNDPRSAPTLVWLVFALWGLSTAAYGLAQYLENRLSQLYLLAALLMSAVGIAIMSQFRGDGIRAIITLFPPTLSLSVFAVSNLPELLGYGEVLIKHLAEFIGAIGRLSSRSRENLDVERGQ